MAKMYFVDTNGGYLTVAVAELPGINVTDFRACYMWQDGREGNYPCNNPRAEFIPSLLFGMISLSATISSPKSIFDDSGLLGG